MKSFVLCISLISLPAWADSSSLAGIQQQLSRPDVLCGQFAQAKTLLGLKKPVKSGGRFCMVNGKGVLWRTQHPFSQDLKLTRDEIIESQGARVTKVLNTRQEPAVRIINSLLFSLMNGDLQQLEQNFSISTQQAGKQWQATLAPKAGNGIDKVIKQVVLSGNAQVQQILLTDQGGDQTDIQFYNLMSGHHALQADEAKQFE
ncbi:hypothetical protein HNQ59_000701 [Chitinivorax tropicus]|uniref:Outer membrane lipoprotein carrier protein LolA n=1 Tax=Chitinivorax tropicus TaxID=714531 RepID=A0A840MKQ1_9PROT|nr:outer membrane lipoprotein carrier protein LolA [Chitinivorax tropicus]MBB5017437.1 hypothetical protein [Chitinivorax tropicus]